MKIYKTLSVEAELLLKFKKAVVMNNTTMKEVTEKLIEDYLIKEGFEND